MESHGFVFMLSWIYVFFILDLCAGMDATRIELKNKVFVALADKSLSVEYTLSKPANQSEGTLRCFAPDNSEIYNFNVIATGESEKNFKETVRLTNLNSSASGEYRCTYETADAYWFLQVRDEDYKAPIHFDNTDYITLGVCSGVLLIFSVVGSIYVYRGHWSKKDAECSTNGQNRSQDRNGSTEDDEMEGDVDAAMSPSTSFYASLEPRPRSVYDVLDHSAANREPKADRQRKPKPGPKNVHQTVEQSTHHQDEGVLDSVYENL